MPVSKENHITAELCMLTQKVIEKITAGVPTDAAITQVEEQYISSIPPHSLHHILTERTTPPIVLKHG